MNKDLQNKSLLILPIILLTLLSACQRSVVEPPPDTETPDTETPDTEIPETDETPEIDEIPEVDNGPDYVDGVYEEIVYYFTPAGEDLMSVTFTVEGDVLVELEVESETNNKTSEAFQDLFLTEVESQIVGKDLDEIPYISSINGSSLLAEAFQDAIYEMRQDAGNF